MNIYTVALILTALCGLTALVCAALLGILPENAHSAMLHETAKMMLFLFSIGAVAILFRALA